MEGKKLIRGLNNKGLKEFKESKWFDFYKKHRNELFLGIRNNYINIYYKGMSIAKIKSPFTRASIADRYRYKNFKEKNKYNLIEYQEFEQKYENIIKPQVEKHIKENKLWEKEVQQKLILKNNKNCKENISNWLCIDMEYIKQRDSAESNEGKSFGRFDIIAVNKKSYEVALIELKVGKGAIGGKSGILKHAKDWQDFKKKKVVSNGDNKWVKKEIINIINNKINLDPDYPIKFCKKEDFDNIEPKFYFLICSGNMTIKEIKNEVRKYLWSEEKCKKYNIQKVSQSYNVEKSEDIGYDISVKNKGPLYCEFLFATGLGEEIDDIIEDKNYDRDIRSF